MPEAISKSLFYMSEQVPSTQLSQMMRDDKEVLLSLVRTEANTVDSAHKLREELQRMMEKNHLLVIENNKLKAMMRTQA